MSLHAPWLPRGTAYGTLLNFRREWDLWAPRMSEAPYKAAPRAPVLYVKTANCFAPAGAAVPVTGEVELGATLGLVIGDFEPNTAVTDSSQARAAINSETDGRARVAGCVLLDDLSLPHASYYRPAIRYRNRDGFLVCAPAVTPLREVDLKALRIEARVNGALVQTVELSSLVRDAAALLADVGAFMTLQPGDVLLLGSDCLPDGTRPRVRAGDRVEISALGLAPLMHTLVQEAA
ncbi:fumarylacetoacetate hydrolase family protein [Ottowia pentelensis]|uniref:Fumarylacetoacetate hydrolase family protein n=1 Tax=Ottowia pentelensis TaxID=511108 RepID=A0ABV6PRQ1_9BURK